MEYTTKQLTELALVSADQYADLIREGISVDDAESIDLTLTKIAIRSDSEELTDRTPDSHSAIAINERTFNSFLQERIHCLIS